MDAMSLSQTATRMDWVRQLTALRTTISDTRFPVLVVIGYSKPRGQVFKVEDSPRLRVERHASQLSHMRSSQCWQDTMWYSRFGAGTQKFIFLLCYGKRFTAVKAWSFELKHNNLTKFLRKPGTTSINYDTSHQIRVHRIKAGVT